MTFVAKGPGRQGGRAIVADLLQLRQEQLAGYRFGFATDRIGDGRRRSLVIAELVVAKRVPGRTRARSHLNLRVVENPGGLHLRGAKSAAASEVDRVVTAQTAVDRTGTAGEPRGRVPNHEIDSHQRRPPPACVRADVDVVLAGRGLP